MKKLIFLLCFLGSNPPSAMAQKAAADGIQQGLFKETPQEQVFIHYNTSLLFAGEYLYYSLYSLDSDKGGLSDLSKMAYVELIGKGGERIFRHKLQLKNGLGHSDFFVPTSLESGNYKLIGYTRWMKNAGGNNYFRADIAIVNPYRGDQSGIMARASGGTEGNQVSPPETNFYKERYPSKEDEHLELTMTTELLGSREKMALQLKSLQEASGNGIYSVSVRKMDAIGVPPRVSSSGLNGLYSSVERGGDFQPETDFLPEIRGSLVSGKIEPTKTAKNVSVKGKKLALSIPGEDFIFKVATTNEEGEFYFNILEYPSETEALLQLIGEKEEDYKISLDPPVKMDYSELEFGDFKITPEINAAIVQRSVFNQIENAYYSIKPDTVRAKAPAAPFYGENPLAYDLDAYTRFGTIKETFIEIIKSAWITKNRLGESIFEVRGLEGAMDYGLPPLLLVDGIMVQDHEHFMEYPAKGVQRIEILRENFFVGTHIFQGIILVKTIEGDYRDYLQDDHFQEKTLERPQPEKDYFQQRYPEAGGAAHIPDFRAQLLWVPSLDFDTEKQELTFYTSDNKGVYEINIEGFTQEGEPVSIKEYFRVE